MVSFEVPTEDPKPLTRQAGIEQRSSAVTVDREGDGGSKQKGDPQLENLEEKGGIRDARSKWYGRPPLLPRKGSILGRRGDRGGKGLRGESH